MLDPKTKSLLRRRLLKWFDTHQRDLPWRKNKTPYRIWVSEIMLQQTQVATVVDYFQRFIARFPTVKRLAAANEAEVLKLWEGLGYYRRARQMHAAANLVCENHNGHFPQDFDEVLALPGVGRYTAGAILSISTDQRLPILEGNTIRLFARLMRLKTDPKTSANQTRLWKFSESLLPQKRVGDFNQALMELGSEICTPRNPACPCCPLMHLCPTFAGGWQSKIPAASKKMVYENIHEAVVIVSRRGKYLLRQCEPGERWAGLWDFPRFRVETAKEDGEQEDSEQEGAEKPESVEQHLTSKLLEQFGFQTALTDAGHSIKHAVTKYRIRLDCYTGEIKAGRLSRSAGQTCWATTAQIAELPMSITGRKIADRLINVRSVRKNND
jgi:A/G-specific adenine glycosylase